MATMKIGTLEADLTLDTSDLKTAEAQVQKTTKVIEKSFGKADRAAKKLATGGLRNSRFAIQQMGFQIQDVAVQLQGGTNALTVFGQQGSQIAGIFGPGGAVIGAVLAIGAAIGSVLVGSLGSATEETKTLKEILKELDAVATETGDGIDILSDQLLRLAKESSAAAQAGIRLGIIRAMEAMELSIKSTNETLKDTFGASTLADFGDDAAKTAAQVADIRNELQISGVHADILRKAYANFLKEGTSESSLRLQGTLDAITSLYGIGNERLIEFTASMRESTSVTNTTAERIKFLTDAQKDLGAAITATNEANDPKKNGKAAEREKEQADRRIKLIEQLGESERETIGRVAKENRDFILAQDQLTADERKALTDSIDAAELDSLEKLEAKKQKIILAGQAITLNAQSQFLGQVSALLKKAGKEGTAIAKAAFLAQKAIQIAQMLAASEVAAVASGAAAALTGGGLPAYAAAYGATKALGFASAGIVAGLAVADTFEHGGVVGGSSFSGDNVIARVNSGEMIFNKTQQSKLFSMVNGSDGGSSPNIIINNNAPGAEVVTQSVTKDQVVLLVRQGVNRGRNEMEASLARGQGSTFKALTQGSNISRNIT